jgi:hypothetical protein
VFGVAPQANILADQGDTARVPHYPPETPTNNSRSKIFIGCGLASAMPWAGYARAWKRTE